MARTYRSRALAVRRELERNLTRLFRDLADAAAAEVTRRADADGNVPRSALPAIQRAVDDRVLALFVGRNRRGELAPFETRAGRVVPLSPYMRTLWRGIESGIRVEVEREANLMRRLLPDDIAAAMRRGRRAPFETVREQVFRPNPNARYDPAHLWVDPNGHTLSDRIWDTAGSTRRRLDALLDDAIRQGRSARDVARDLEQFLVPGRQLRTRKPYGTDASFDAMRLARTEITRASGEASQQAARMNPLVNGMKWNLSPSHGCCDICDDRASGGPNGDGVYSMDALPRYPAHPQCVLPGQTVATRRGDVPIEDVQAGDWVLTHQGRYAPVNFAWSNPHRGRVYQIATGETKLLLTGNHPVLTCRGWVNAESLQTGDQVLHAAVSVSPNPFTVISEDAPTATFEPSVAADVMTEVGFMPARTIALDTDHDIWESEVDAVASNHVFMPEENFSTNQCLHHGDFRAAGIGETFSPMPLEHGHQAGIVFSLCLGDFTGNFRTFRRVVFSGKIMRQHRLAHSVSGDLAPGSIIMSPGSTNAFASAAQRDSVLDQQFAQDSIGQPVSSKNFGRCECLTDVDVDQKISDRQAALMFEADRMPFDDSQSMSFGVAMGDATEALTANGADDHDNLLSLSPDNRVGHGSGNPFVSEVASPAQAHLHYSTVQSVEVFDYDGPVYNMEVETDHSYTVNGAVVHNCMCYLTQNLIPSGQREQLFNELRDDIRQARAELVDLLGPLAVERFTQALLNGELDVTRPDPAELERLAA